MKNVYFSFFFNLQYLLQCRRDLRRQPFFRALRGGVVDVVMACTSVVMEDTHGPFSVFRF